MTTTDNDSVAINDDLILICGKSTTGKSYALKNIENQDGVMYLNCEAGKKLPFRNTFQSYVITDPLDVFVAFDAAEDQEEIHTIVIDTLTFLLDMYYSEHIHPLPEAKRGAKYADYAEFFKKLMQSYVARSTKNVIILAHTHDKVNEVTKDLETLVPIAGKSRERGVEALFSTVISTKRLSLKQLEGYENDLLTITPREERLGYKHVFQTDQTASTTHERMRNFDEMWDESETFIDNNVQYVLDRIKAYEA